MMQVETEERLEVRVLTCNNASTRKEGAFRRLVDIFRTMLRMYPPMEMDDGEYYMKAMNCPFHHLVYGNKRRSYRELPMRIAEYGTVYRNELSGTLAGLL